MGRTANKRQTPPPREHQRRLAFISGSSFPSAVRPPSSWRVGNKKRTPSWGTTASFHPGGLWGPMLGAVGGTSYQVLVTGLVRGGRLSEDGCVVLVASARCDRRQYQIPITSHQQKIRVGRRRRQTFTTGYGLNSCESSYGPTANPASLPCLNMRRP